MTNAYSLLKSYVSKIDEGFEPSTAGFADLFPNLSDSPSKFFVQYLEHTYLFHLLPIIAPKCSIRFRFVFRAKPLAPTF